MSIKLNGLGHVGGCGCGTCGGCATPSQLGNAQVQQFRRQRRAERRRDGGGRGAPLIVLVSPEEFDGLTPDQVASILWVGQSNRNLAGLGGPPPNAKPVVYPAPLTSNNVQHLSYSQYQQALNNAPPGTSMFPAAYEPPPDLWRQGAGGPSPGMDSRTQQQQAWEQGTSLTKSYTDVIDGNFDRYGATVAQQKALNRAAQETDPLARARALEDARALGDEAARLAAGGVRRPGVPVKRTVQWEEASSGGYAEIQQREMERRGVKTVRPPGWQANLETERLRAEKAKKDAAQAKLLAKQRADAAARRVEADRVNRERQVALKARAEAEKARQAAAEKAARVAARAPIVATWSLQVPTPVVQQARQATQAKPARRATPAKPGGQDVARWGAGAYGLNGLGNDGDFLVSSRLCPAGSLQVATQDGVVMNRICRPARPIQASPLQVRQAPVASFPTARPMAASVPPVRPAAATSATGLAATIAGVSLLGLGYWLLVR